MRLKIGKTKICAAKTWTLRATLGPGRLCTGGVWAISLLILNGKEYLISKDKNIAGLVNDLDIKNKSFALAVNGEVVKKEMFEDFIILPESKIEIISAVGGG